MIGADMRAFTLVDLLVSITIIALIMSIMLPALARMREVRDDQRCIVQVRTVTLGIVGYANEHNRLLDVPSMWMMGAEGPVTATAILRRAILQWIEPCDEPQYQVFTRPWCCDLDGQGNWQRSGVSYIYPPSHPTLRLSDYERSPMTPIWMDWKAQRNGRIHIGRIDGSVGD